MIRKPHEPTPAELNEQARRKKFRFTYLSDQPWPKYDYYVSGALAFVVQGTENDGLRRRWGDTKRQRLENALPSIVRSFKEHAVSQVRKRQYWEDWNRRWKEDEARRHRNAEAARVDKKRFELATDIDQTLSDIALLTRVIHHLETFNERDGRLDTYLNWARERCRHMMTSLNDRQLSARLASDDFQTREY